MRRFQIEDRRQQEENGEGSQEKKNPPLALPLPQQVQGESS